MAKALIEVKAEVQEAFTKDLDALCERYSVKLMPTMFLVQEKEVDDNMELTTEPTHEPDLEVTT